VRNFEWENALAGWNGADVGNRQRPSRQFRRLAIQTGEDMPPVISHPLGKISDSRSRCQLYRWTPASLRSGMSGDRRGRSTHFWDRSSPRGQGAGAVATDLRGTELTRSVGRGKETSSSDAPAGLYSWWEAVKAETCGSSRCGIAREAMPDQGDAKPFRAREGRALNPTRGVARNGRPLVNTNCPIKTY
jgi:hypothetical protein